MDKEIVFELRKSVPGHVFRERMTRSALRKRTGSHERVFIRREEEEHEPRHEEYRTLMEMSHPGKSTRSGHRDDREYRTTVHRESRSGHRDSGRGHRESRDEHKVSRRTRNGHHVVEKHSRVRVEEHH